MQRRAGGDPVLGAELAWLVTTQCRDGRATTVEAGWLVGGQPDGPQSVFHGRFSPDPRAVSRAGSTILRGGSRSPSSRANSSSAAALPSSAGSSDTTDTGGSSRSASSKSSKPTSAG